MFPDRVQKERRVRPEAFQTKIIEMFNRLRIQIASKALIGDRRIQKPVAKHDFAFFQSWQNGGNQMLAAAGGVQKRFGFRIHFIFGIEQNVPDLFRAAIRPARG